MKTKWVELNKLHLALMAILSLNYMLPFLLTKGVVHFSSQDTLFHFARILGLENSWQSPVNFDTFHHNGLMMNVFYPYLTIYPAFLLTKLFGSLIIGYKLYLVLLTFATMLIAYYAMQTIKHNENTSFLFALLYTFAAYRTTDIYYRQSLGESVAMTIFPLILAGTYAIFKGDYTKWKILTAGMTLLLYTHLLSVAMAVVMIAFFFLLTVAFWNEKAKRVKRLCYATGMTLLLSLGFLVPFLFRMNTNQLNTPTGINLVSMPLDHFFEFTLKNAPNGYTIGLVLFIGAIFSLLSIFKLSKADRLILVTGIFLVVVTTSLFNWDKLNHTPLLSLQFVWRLNALATLLLAYTFAVSLTFIKRKQQLFGTAITLVAVVVFHFVAITNLYATKEVFNYISTKNDEIYHLNEQQVLNTKTDFMTADYFTKSAMDHLDIAGNYDFLINNTKQKVNYHFNDNTFTIQTNQQQAGDSLVTPLLHYSGQTISINGKPIKDKATKSGLTEVVLPKGTANIKISYHYQLIERLFMLISLAALYFFIGIKRPTGAHRKKQKSRLQEKARSLGTPPPPQHQVPKP